MRIPASLIIGDERFDEGFDVLEANDCFSYGANGCDVTECIERGDSDESTSGCDLLVFRQYCGDIVCSAAECSSRRSRGSRENLYR